MRTMRNSFPTENPCKNSVEFVPFTTHRIKPRYAGERYTVLNDLIRAQKRYLYESTHSDTYHHYQLLGRFRIPSIAYRMQIANIQEETIYHFYYCIQFNYPEILNWLLINCLQFSIFSSKHYFIQNTVESLQTNIKLC